MIITPNTHILVERGERRRILNYVSMLLVITCLLIATSVTYNHTHVFTHVTGYDTRFTPRPRYYMYCITHHILTSSNVKYYLNSNECVYPNVKMIVDSGPNYNTPLRLSMQLCLAKCSYCTDTLTEPLTLFFMLDGARYADHGRKSDACPSRYRVSRRPTCCYIDMYGLTRSGWVRRSTSMRPNPRTSETPILVSVHPMLSILFHEPFTDATPILDVITMSVLYMRKHELFRILPTRPTFTVHCYVDIKRIPLTGYLPFELTVLSRTSKRTNTNAIVECRSVIFPRIQLFCVARITTIRSEHHMLYHILSKYMSMCNISIHICINTLPVYVHVKLLAISSGPVTRILFMYPMFTRPFIIFFSMDVLVGAHRRVVREIRTQHPQTPRHAAPDTHSFASSFSTKHYTGGVRKETDWVPCYMTLFPIGKLTLYSGLCVLCLVSQGLMCIELSVYYTMTSAMTFSVMYHLSYIWCYTAFASSVPSWYNVSYAYINP